MTEHLDAYRIATQLGRVSPLVSYASPFSEKVNGSQAFVFAVTRRLTTDEMVSICQGMARVIRHEIPERPDGWAVLIYADQFGSPVMGTYCIGWAGRDDEWHLRDGQERKATDHVDWLALFERLRVALSAIGKEGERPRIDGDFRLMDEECGRREHTLFIHRPEFLTRELIATIQNVLREGYDDWVVDVRPSFPAPLEKLFRGIRVRVDGIEEKWKRRQVERMLGDRLKI